MTALFFVVYCKSTVLGVRKWNLLLKIILVAIVIKSSNPMKQSARELIECGGIQTVNIQGQETPMLSIVMY